jgi:hypothetical protein
LPRPPGPYFYRASEVIDGLTLENSAQPINFDGSALPW